MHSEESKLDLRRVCRMICVIIIGCFLVTGTVRSTPQEVGVVSSAFLSKQGIWEMGAGGGGWQEIKEEFTISVPAEGRG